MASALRLEPHNRVAGKYRLRRRIAVGGMGEIWVAKNEATQADVALKVLRADADPTLHAAERFRHEAKLSAMLSHRSIVRIFDLVEEPGGALVLVMELLRGETLQHYLERKGPRPPKEAIAIIGPVLSALQHAHEHGVIHRDVTPSNIFLSVDPDGQVTPKLVDFGIARAEGQAIKTLDGRVLGTPRYMSPEQIRAGSSDKLDGRSDIFSVGVVLYEVLTGASPFATSNAAASLAAVLETPVDPDPRIEPKLWVEIQRALSKQAYERHGSANELANALRAAVGESDAALTAALRRTRPPVITDADLSGPLPLVQDHTQSVEGQSVALTLPGKRGAAVWVFSGAAAGIAVLALALTIRTVSPGKAADAPPSLPSTHGAPSAAPPPQAAPATPPASAPIAAPTAPPPPAPTAAPTTAPAPSPAVTARPAPRPVNAPRVRPVATTPGF